MTKDTTLTAAQLKELTFELQVERARLKRATFTQHAERSAAGAPESESTEPFSATENGVTLADADADARLDAIEAALERIENGTYGNCTGCEQPIPYGRLLVMPEATHCVGCWPRS
jgi:DnaK suppressor protein